MEVVKQASTLVGKGIAIVLVGLGILLPVAMAFLIPYGIFVKVFG